MTMRKQDVKTVAFKSRWKLYELVAAQLDVTCAPTQFINVMDDVLWIYLDDFVTIFLGDILIYSTTLEEHADHFQSFEIN